MDNLSSAFLNSLPFKLVITHFIYLGLKTSRNPEFLLVSLCQPKVSWDRLYSSTPWTPFSDSVVEDGLMEELEVASSLNDQLQQCN